jgi:hypothetical protein
MRGSLHATFRALLGLAGVGATTLPLVGCDNWACGSKPGDDPRRGRAGSALEHSPDFSPVPCDGAEYPQALYLTDLAPAEPFDCLELRSYDTTLETEGSGCSALGPAASSEPPTEALNPRPDDQPALQELPLGSQGQIGHIRSRAATVAPVSCCTSTSRAT